MGYKIVDHANIIKVGKSKLYVVTDDIIELEVEDEIVYDILLKLKKGCKEEELLEYCTEDELKNLLDVLVENKLLVENYENMYLDEIVEKQVYYFDKFNDNSNKLQEKLCNSKVALLGVGGIGAVVIQHLVASGIKEFILIDNDVVQKNNLNRQFIYNSSNIGKAKVNCAKEYIESIDSNIKVSVIKTMITDSSKLDFLKEMKPDILVNAADRPKEINYIVNEFCTQNSIPWIGAAVGISRGTWGPLFIPKQTICFKCFDNYNRSIMSEVEKSVYDNCNVIINGSCSVTNTIVSAFLSKEVIKFLIGKAPNTLIQYEINFDNFEINKYKYNQNSSCKCWVER